MENLNTQTLSDKDRIVMLEAQLKKDRSKPNHLLHIIIALATGGLSLPIYAYVVYKHSKVA